MAPISIWLANDRFIHQKQNIIKQYPAMAANSISSHSKMWFEEASISPRESSESHGVASPPKSQPSPHPVPSEICFLSGVLTQRGEICDVWGGRGHRARLVRGQTPAWIMLSGRLGLQCFGWWRTVGKRPPPSLACLRAWINVNECGTLRLTKLCLTVKDPTWWSSMCNNSNNLVAFFIASLVLVSTKFLLGLSWRILQPSPQLLEHTLKKKTKSWIGFFPDCHNPWLLERWADSNAALAGFIYPLLMCLRGQGHNRACWNRDLFATESPGASSFFRGGESYFTFLPSLGEDNAKNLLLAISK